jgi:photosystem II stability/assembly factor-like uncharacterized protein
MCQRRYLWLAAICIALGSATAAMAGPLEGVQAFKRLSAPMGWAADSGTLFWTNDAGQHWENRTPPGANQLIANVFFLDAAAGWALLARADDDAQLQFDVAATEDAGQTWVISHVEIPNRIADEFSGQGSLFFLDRQHGWIDLSIASGSAFRPGKMLMTDDGGATWKESVGEPGVAGSFCFFSLRDGVLSGGPANTEFYVTHDGSTSWQRISLNAAQAVPPDFATYGAPACNGQHGSLPVTYSGPEGTHSDLILYETENAGHEFQPDRVLRDLEETAPGQEITTALGDSQLITLSVADKFILRLTAVPKSGNQLTEISQVGGAPFSIVSASFSDVSRGWVLTSFGLLSTSDGGVTWSDVTPTGRTRAMPSDFLISTTNDSEPNDASLLENSNATTGVSKNTRLGFDIGFVPKTAQMKTWWQFSPYYESGLYVPGAANKKPDPNLNSAWLTSAIADGWGFIPIWVGPQAPCVIQTGLKLINATNPASQGQAEAAKAIAAAKTLSSRLGPIIYYNMENYNTSNSSCRMIVRAFLNGWTSAMHSHGYKAGVYGNPVPASLDFSQLSPLPDDAWISVVPLPAKSADVSIWGLSSLCDHFSKTACDLWPNSQRIHQYLINHSETWGGQTLTVDRDVLDADVAVSSVGAKPYVFQYASIDYPQATLTALYGINNAGDMVGEYFSSDNKQHGFLYTKGVYTTIDYPGAASTRVYSINDAGQIVGLYNTSKGNSGFLYNKGLYTTISLKNNFNEEPLAITDDGLILGNYANAFFLENPNNGVTTTINCLVCGVNFLNGNAYAVGSQANVQPSTFLYNAVSGKFTFISEAPPTSGVNDNLQMVGFNVLYDSAAKKVTSIQYPGTSSLNSYVGAINDFSELVGTWYDSKGVGHGFIACPKGYPKCPAP